MPRLVLALASLVLVLPLAPVRAQPPSSPPVHVERRSVELAGGAVARLATRWTTDGASSGASLAVGDAAPVVLVRGASAASIERGERVAVVAYEAYDGGPPFRLRAVRHDGGADVLGVERTLARPGARQGDIPFAVAIAPVPGRGFAVFFEEVQSDDPSAARTYLFMLGLDGEPTDSGREIAVPWPLAAAAWNGHGFHLALLYPGGSDGMRLSMVSTTPEGNPEQHPDWSSAAGFVADVHLVTVGAAIHAHYRGGPGGARWYETDVTVIEAWGSDRRHASDHGAIDPDATLVVDAAGHVRRIAARDDGLAAR